MKNTFESFECAKAEAEILPTDRLMQQDDEFLCSIQENAKGAMAYCAENGKQFKTLAKILGGIAAVFALAATVHATRLSDITADNKPKIKEQFTASVCGIGLATLMMAYPIFKACGAGNKRKFFESRVQAVDDILVQRSGAHTIQPS